MELIVKDIKREYNLETAPSVGRYTLINNQLELEFFSPSGGGHYTKKKGYVRNDTIFLTKEFSRLYFGFYSQSLLRSKLIIMSEYQIDIQINN